MYVKYCKYLTSSVTMSYAWTMQVMNKSEKTRCNIPNDSSCGPILHSSPTIKNKFLFTKSVFCCEWKLSHLYSHHAGLTHHYSPDNEWTFEFVQHFHTQPDSPGGRSRADELSQGDDYKRFIKKNGMPAPTEAGPTVFCATKQAAHQ